MAEDTPSRLRPANSRHDEISKRLQVIKGSAAKFGLIPEDKLADDEHYWLLTMNEYGEASDVLKIYIPDEEERRKAAMTIAVKAAEKLWVVQEEVAIDQPTGAWSRRTLDNYLSNIINAKKKDQSLSIGLMFIDSDDFKQINKESGHPGADEKLKELVETAVNITRPIDLVARYGGDEFCVVFVGVSSEAVLEERSESIRESVEKNLGFTISAGITMLRDTDSVVDFYKRADKNLYVAKDSGGNLVANDTGVVKPQ